MDFTFITDEELRKKAIEAHESEMAEIKDTMKTEFKSDMQSAIDEAVQGLKSKNNELLDEKKKISSTLKNFEDIDPEKAKEALKFLEENEDARLIRDGKIDELLDRRTSQMRSDHEAKTKEISDELLKATQQGTLYEGLYKAKIVEDAIRAEAHKAKVRPEAIKDILLRGKSVFSLSEDGKTVESRDKNTGKLTKTADDKVLTTTNWLEGLKKESPHYWMQSNSANAYGNHNTGDRNEAMIRAANSGDMEAFRKLREK